MSRRGRCVAAALLALAAAGGPTAFAPPTAHGSDEVVAEVAVVLRDAAIDESSGLVVRGDSLFTVNDSGDGPLVYQVSMRSGRTVAVTRFSGEDPVDVEALAPGRDGAVWVGDIGDNRRSRGSVRLYRLVPAPGGGEVAATSYDLVYPDRAHDAETLLVHPRTGRVLVVTKRFAGGGAVYRAPRRLRPGATHQLERLAPVAGMVTDGTFLRGGDRVLLRTYGTAAVYTYPGFEPVVQLALPAQEQGEAVAVGSDGRVYLTSEGARSAVLVLDLPSAPERAHRPERPAGIEAPDSPGLPLAVPGAVLGCALVLLAVRGLRASRPRSRHRP